MLHDVLDLLSKVYAFSRVVLDFWDEIGLDLSHLVELVLRACLGYDLGKKSGGLESSGLTDCALLGSEQTQLA